MFTAIVLLCHLRIRAVWDDAAYFNYAFLGFVRNVLHASVNADYNLRRQGKRFLATLFFVRQWRYLMSPRTNFERHFAWMKRYSGRCLLLSPPDQLRKGLISEPWNGPLPLCQHAIKDGLNLAPFLR